MSTDAKRRANAKYIAEKTENITLRVPMGGKEPIKKHAEIMGESVNGFIQRAITEQMKRDENRAD